MEVHHLIVHELVKAPQENEARLFLSKSCLPPEERAQQLIRKLNQTFEQKADTLLGYFSPPEDALFPGYFHLLAEANYTEEAFTSFSRETMQALQLSLQGVTGAKGGYLVYAYYTVGEQQFLGIFLVRDTEGVVFDRQSDTFNLRTITHLNTDRLAMAGRINLNAFRAGHERCLELIRHANSQRTISEYFTNWIGLDRPASSRELTNSFLEMVEHLPTPPDEETGTPMPREAFQEQVMQYAMSSPQKTISVQAFDEEFYNSQPTAQAYVQEQALPLKDEFRFDQGTLKRHFQVRLSANSIRLQFDRSDYQDGLVRIEGDEIIIASPELVQRLREQL